MKHFLKSKTTVWLLAIICLAACCRIYGLNWDQNHHLQPDERFLTMVVGDLSWPRSIAQYFDSKSSLLNPYNVNHGFFVYGMLPLLIVKAVAGVIRLDRFDYNNITLVGRLLSAVFDLGAIILVFKIGKRIFSERIGLVASFFYSVSVLPIQLSHFFTVDTFLTFFVLMSFYFLIFWLDQPICRQFLTAVPLGVFFGLSLACKISAIFFLPIIGIGFLFNLKKKKSFVVFLSSGFIFALSGYLSLRLADPRLFAGNNLLNLKINPQFLSNLAQLRSLSSPESLYPPSIQWFKTRPIIFPLKNIILWGLGLPLGILSLSGVLFSFYFTLSHLKKLSDQQNLNHLLITIWVIYFFFYQATQSAKSLRYFLFLYPFLAILAAQFLFRVIKLFKWKINFLLFIPFLVWPLSFMSIYSRPHSRVLASLWIYENIPPGSIISCEYWDDCLPLAVDMNTGDIYKNEMISPYDSDTPEKWQKINGQLEKIDYLILSSNRLWGSIPRVPEIYPITARFYQDLFTEKLQFRKVAEITSYPTIPILGIKIPDNLAEEAFSVFDHPKVLIFEKK